MEQNPGQWITYVVQFWVEGYEFWSDVVEPAERMFGVPNVGRETEAGGREQLRAMVEANPGGTYHLIRRTVTTEVIA